MSAKNNTVASPYYIAVAMAALALCLAVAAILGGCGMRDGAFLAAPGSSEHAGFEPTTMPAPAWANPAAGEDPLDKAVFDQAMGLVMNGQYQQASGRFSSLLARLEAGLAADKGLGPTTNPAQSPLQPSTAPAGDSDGAAVRMAAESMFWIAYCAEKQGQIAQAAALYNKVQANYPGTPAASQAARRLNLLKGG